MILAFPAITRYFYFNDVTLHENRLGSRREIFASETGYQTPKVDIRAVVFKMKSYYL